MKPLLAIFFLTSLSFACKPVQNSLQDYKGTQIIVANGGGFTGQVIEYILLEDGRVFKTNSLDQTTTLHKKVDKNVAKQVFINFNVLGIKNLSLNDPGNMYYYIKIKTNDEEHLIKWNSESEGADVERAKLFYQTVINRLR